MQIFYPLFVLFGLTSFVALRLGYLRYRAVAREEMDGRYFKLYRDFPPEPDYLRQWSRHLMNLFETPILFYVATLVAFVTGQTGTLVVGLCWAYVGLRLVHSIVHLTSNKVLIRFQVFGMSWLALIALWVTVLIGIVRAGGN